MNSFRDKYTGMVKMGGWVAEIFFKYAESVVRGAFLKSEKLLRKAEVRGSDHFPYCSKIFAKSGNAATSACHSGCRRTYSRMKRLALVICSLTV